MPKLSAIQQPQDTRELELTFGDDANPVIVHVTVLPDAFTLGRQRQIRKAGASNDLAAMADAMLAVVQSWDIEDDEGKVLPLNQAGVDTLKFETVLALVNKMTEALNAPKSATSSS